MGTVLIFPDLASPVAVWDDLAVGHRQRQVVDYRQLVEEPTDFDQLTAAAIALVRATPQPVTLLGHGFGAFLALAVATTQFGRLDRLLLVTPAYQLPSIRGRLANLHLKRQGAFASTALGKKATLQLYQTAANRDLTNQLMHVQCRVEIYCGEQDRAHRGPAEDLYRRLLEGHLTMVPQMGTQVTAGTRAAIAESLR